MTTSNTTPTMTAGRAAEARFSGDEATQLRALAADATAGDWEWKDYYLPTLVGELGPENPHGVLVLEVEHGKECSCWNECRTEMLFDDNDKAWIAAANPKRIIRLLNELDQVRSELILIKENL